MKNNSKALVIAIAIPLLTGFLSGFLSQNSMNQFAMLNMPALSPPGFLFPVVWTILYTLMGIASYLIFSSNKKQQDIDDALTVYGVQLVVNFFWSIFFFRLEWYLFAFFWLILLWVLVLYTILLFYRIFGKACREKNSCGYKA